MKIISSLIVPPVSAKDAVRFIPESERDKETPQSFTLRPPNYSQRTAVDQATMPLVLKLPPEQDVNSAAAAAVNVVVAPEDRDATLEILGAYGAFLDDPSRLKDDKSAAEGLTKQARDIHRQLQRYWPPLAKLVAERITVIGQMRFETARVYLTGWDNVPVAFEVDADGLVSADCLVKLGPRVAEIADFIQKISAPDETTAKN